jgi:hypothetical protein
MIKVDQISRHIAPSHRKQSGISAVLSLSRKIGETNFIPKDELLRYKVINFRTEYIAGKLEPFYVCLLQLL